jgi:predicted O-methyltransferase YrrM
MELRSLKFRTRAHNRYWWYKLTGTDYVPPVIAELSKSEWALMEDWFEDSEKLFPNPGEISIPGISLLNALICGNGVGAVVQLGHYVGFSTLMLGFALRRIGRKRALFSVDIDAEVTQYTQSWVKRAKLEDVVSLHVENSSDAIAVELAHQWFGRTPELVFIDSSHQYRHTLEELDLWYKSLAPGGFLAMHDTSVFAQTFDSTGEGGVRRAACEWGAGRNMILLNSFVGESVTDGDSPSSLIYRDRCGFGLVQKDL